MVKKRMFGMLGGVLALAILIGALGVWRPVRAQEEDAFVPGDVNGSGAVDIGDARMVLQHLVEKITLDENRLIAANVDGKGVSITSARLILQFLVDKIDGFPDAQRPPELPDPPPGMRPAVLPTADGPLEGAVDVVIKDKPDTFCNPINISYQFQNDDSNSFNSRESADPALIIYKGEYFLFASHGTGYWWSTDMLTWNFVYVSKAAMPEINYFAPAVCVIGDTVYLTHSSGGAIYKSDDPKGGQWTRVGKPIHWDDPALFVDDDGSVYCYYGCSPVDPLKVVKLNPNENMKVIEGPVEIYQSNKWANGFEMSGDKNEVGNDPWLEGPWMTKHEGKYYLEFGVPGTDAAYADACAVADAPMGPFTLCTNSPVSYKATGYLMGAGHGSTLRDLHGNYWKIDTAVLSVNTMFERRLVLFPSTINAERQEMYANMVRADYPIYLPEIIGGGFENPGPDWHLVSYGPAAVSSSSNLNSSKGPDKAFNENIRSWWSASTGNAGEWIEADFGKLVSVNALQINFAEQDATGKNNLRSNSWVTRYLVEFSQDGGTWHTLVDKSGAVAEPNKAQDYTHDYFELAKRIGIRYIRVTNKGPVPAGGKFAISGIRLFGHGGGDAPAELTDFTVNRPVSDERTVTLSWTAVPGAQGYFIRYGSREDARHIQWQVIGANTATIRNLMMGVDYWFTIDTYNDSGYTPGTVAKKAGWTVPRPARPVEGPDPENFKDTDKYPVYEAEAATVNNADIRSDRDASGGKSVGNLHNAGAYLEFKNIEGGPEGGAGTLWIVYSNGNGGATVRTTVTVNGTILGQFVLPSTANWDTFKGFGIPVTGLTPGATNTIRLGGGMGGFNADFIQVVYE